MSSDIVTEQRASLALGQAATLYDGSLCQHVNVIITTDLDLCFNSFVSAMMLLSSSVPLLTSEVLRLARPRADRPPLQYSQG